MYEEKTGTITLIGNLPVWGNSTILMPEEFSHVKGNAFYSMWDLHELNLFIFHFKKINVVGGLKPAL